MAGVTVKIDDKEFQRRIEALRRGVIDATPLMKLWGEIAHASIVYNFEVGGRPAWKKLSKVTVQLKGHDKILRGRTGNLARITVKPGSKSVLLGTSPASRAYAAIQNFGGQAGRGRKVKVPARPFMVLQPEDKTEMAAVAKRYLQRIGS